MRRRTPTIEVVPVAGAEGVVVMRLSRFALVLSVSVVAAVATFAIARPIGGGGESVRPLPGSFVAALDAGRTPERVDVVAGATSAVAPDGRTVPFVVRVSAGTGRPLSGVDVRFELAVVPPLAIGTLLRVGGGDHVDVSTGSDGLAAVTAEANDRPGQVVVRARVLDRPDLPMPTFAVDVVAPGALD